MTVKDRVRKHRAQNRENGFVRLEVCLGLGLIDIVRKCAKQKNVSMREVVEDALSPVHGIASPIPINLKPV